MEPETKALNDINVNFQPGQFIAIIGPSGCGKSTFLRLMANLINPYQRRDPLRWTIPCCDAEAG